jgi:repressor LexA
MEKLTKRQEDTLKFIKEYIVSHGYPPTVREIAKELDVSSPATIQAHLDRLADKGYIKKGSNKNRTIELMVENEFKTANETIIDVPLLGKITAGNPIEAIENPDNYFSLPSYLVPKDKEVFTLVVDGESMIEAGILDGDIIIVERRNTARNGEIVVAMTEDNEVTLKRFYKEKDHIRLQPENSTMEPIILNNAFVLGKAIGLYRQI